MTVKRIRWNTHDISFKRSNHWAVIFKLNNSKKWFEINAMCTTQTAKEVARRMAQYYGAEQVEMKYLWNDETDRQSEPDENMVTVVDLSAYSHETPYKFRRELFVPDGQKRRFVYFEESEIFYLTKKETKC